MPSPQSRVMVCRDHAVRPTGRVSTCYAVYSVVKVLRREFLQVQDTIQLPSLSMESGY